MINSDLQARVNNIYNHLYANSLKRTPHGISFEVGKVLHSGMYIEEVEKSDSAFSFNAKQLAEIKNNDAVTAEYANRIRSIFSRMNKAWKFYEKEEAIILNDFDLVYTCIQLNGLNLSDNKRDVFGDTIEIIRGQWAKQVGGQFFTDGLVTNLAMKFLDFDPRRGDDLVDICSGTGGFLLAGLNHIRELLESDGVKNVETQLVALAKKSLKGQEIDSEVCKIANASLEARLGRGTEEFVKNGDSILPSNFTSGKFIRYGAHRCVASNPPFGTKITIKDFKILKDYELAKQSPRGQTALFNEKVSHRAPDILFLEQNLKLLIKGEGRLSIVLPYQILSGPQTQYVRNWLLKNAIIESVIDLPSETFQPHTGTKTSLLTIRRRLEPLESLDEMENYSIFCSMPRWIGHDRRGNPIFKKLPNGKNSNEILTDFPDVYKAFCAFKEGKNPSEVHSDSFVITSDMIKAEEFIQFNAQFHKPATFSTKQGKKKISKNWEFVPMEHLVKQIFYPTRFKRDYVDRFDGAVPFFGGADINQLIHSTDKWFSPLHPKVNELKVKKNWLLITRSGSTGIASIVPEAWEGFAMSEHIIRIVPDENKLSPFYLLNFLKSDYCQEIIARGVFGSVIDEIDPLSLAKIEVPIPKDKKLLAEIIRQVELAETARNQAIEVSRNSLVNLNSVFEKEFSLAD